MATARACADSTAMDMRTHAPVTGGLEQIEPWLSLPLRDGSDLVAVVASGGLVRYVSPSVKRICGYQPDEALGKSFLDFVHPDDAIGGVHDRGLRVRRDRA